MRDNIVTEPDTTPSILANVPDSLCAALKESVQKTTDKQQSLLISSNSLANRFIFERWGIRPSQRRRFKNLYSTVRKQCRAIFRNYVARGRINWTSGTEEFVFGIYKFDEIRGNIILGFVHMTHGSEWSLQRGV
ncbi:MAG: hypothetical protein ACFFDM_05795 [Candidatus Thorarchaeota archaeon]